MTGRTLYDKIWDLHQVHGDDDASALLYIDRHLVHEVTSPQAFEGLEIAQAPALAQAFDPRRAGPQRTHHRP